MNPSTDRHDLDRRRFISSIGKGLGLAALSSTTVASLLNEVRAAARGSPSARRCSSTWG
ncbi:MAG TPA: hypothetical protein VF064_20445 [Pyrinomonadaceae bacterium]